MFDFNIGDIDPRLVQDQQPDATSTATSPQQQIDPMELVRQLLAPPAPQPVPQKSTMGTIGQILNAIAGGVAVGASQDPGKALQGQLQQREQMKFQAAQAQKDREEKLNLLNRQFGLQVLGNQLGEQSQIRQEDRAEKRGDRTRQSEFDDYIKKNNIQFDQTLTRDTKQNEARKAEAILQHQWDTEKQDNLEYQFWYQQNRLENKELFDKKISLIQYGVPAGAANSIANKMFYGEDLTPSESKTITAAAQRQLKLAAKAAGSGSSHGGLSDKQESSFLVARMKDQFVVVDVPVIDPITGQPAIDPNTKQVIKQEQIMEMSNAPRDMSPTGNGKIIGLKRVASQGEKMKLLADEADGLQALKNPGVRQALRTGTNPQQQSIQGGDQTVKINHYKGIVKQATARGDSIQQIVAGLESIKQQAPKDAQAIDAILSQFPKGSTSQNQVFSEEEKKRFIQKYPNKIPK